MFINIFLCAKNHSCVISRGGKASHTDTHVNDCKVGCKAVVGKWIHWTNAGHFLIHQLITETSFYSEIHVTFWMENCILPLCNIRSLVEAWNQLRSFSTALD